MNYKTSHKNRNVKIALRNKNVIFKNSISKEHNEIMFHYTTKLKVYEPTTIITHIFVQFILSRLMPEIHKEPKSIKRQQFVKTPLQFLSSHDLNCQYDVLSRSSYSYIHVAQICILLKVILVRTPS